jgi:hypothetical protein
MWFVIPYDSLQQASPKVVLRNVLMAIVTIILCFDGLTVYGLLPVGAAILNVVKVSSLFALLFYGVFFRHEIEKKDFLLCLTFVPVFWIYSGEENPVTAGLKIISRFVPLFAFILIDRDSKYKILNVWFKFYTLTLLPGIIIHLLKLGLSIPFPVNIFTNIQGEVYDSHFFIYFYNRWNYIRFCGIYDEPGIIGTYSFLMLLFFSHYLTRFQKAIIWISGLLSLSFFFFGTIPFIWVTHLLLKRKYVRLTLSTFLLAGLVALTPLIIAQVLKANNKSDIYNDLIFHTIKNRFNISEGSNSITSIKSNRLNTQNYTFDQFKKEDATTILLGNFFTMGSKKFNDISGSGLGIEINLYQYGLLYTLYNIFLIGLIVLLPTRNKLFHWILLFLALLICYYQRPYLYRIEFLSLMYIGVLELKKIVAKKESLPIA